MEKVFTVESDVACPYCGVPHNTAVFSMPEESGLQVAEYFRLLSVNYRDYASGKMPWPERPDKLKSDDSYLRRYCADRTL